MMCAVAGYDRVRNRYLVDVASPGHGPRRKVKVRPACLVWPVGTMVCINGLVVSPEHNGAWAKVVAYDGGRYTVKLDSPWRRTWAVDTLLKIKPLNVHVSVPGMAMSP